MYIITHILQQIYQKLEVSCNLFVNVNTLLLGWCSCKTLKHHKKNIRGKKTSLYKGILVNSHKVIYIYIYSFYFSSQPKEIYILYLFYSALVYVCQMLCAMDDCLNSHAVQNGVCFASKGLSLKRPWD